MVMNDYLLYQLKNPTNNEIFYIGITTNLKKRMKYHYETSKKAFKANPYKARIIYDLKQHGLKPISNIVFESLSFHEAKELEVLAILALKFHGVNLTNISDGGDIVSEETRKKLSLMRKGKKLSMEIRMAMSKRLKGRLLSEEHKKNISNALKGQKNRIRGKSPSEETKNKIRENLKIKMSGKGNPNYGKRYSKDEKRKMQIAMLGDELSSKLSSYDFLHEQYIILNKSAMTIAVEIGTSQPTVSKALRKLAIKK